MKKIIEKNEALLYIGAWTSKLGNIIFDYANSVSIVMISSRKPWVLVLYQNTETVVQIIFNLIGGVKADNCNRKKLVIITDLLSAVTCFVLSVFLETGIMAQVMIVANALLAFLYAFNSPTYKSLVKEVIKLDRIGLYNSVSNMGIEIVGILGPIVGLGLVNIIGARVALIFDGLTFLFSAILEIQLKQITSSSVGGGSNKSIIKEIIVGIKYLVSEKNVFFMIIISAAVNFFLAGYNMLIPYTDKMFYGSYSNFYGKILTVEAVGGIIGSLLCVKIPFEIKDKVANAILPLFFTGLSLIVFPFIVKLDIELLSLIPFFFFGLSLTSYNIQFISYVQTAVDECYLGRVFSIIFTVAVMFMPIGGLVLSLLLDVYSADSFFVVGVGIVFLSIMGRVLYKSII